jgi:hypothetical protein
VGAVVYVRRASMGWRIPEEMGQVPITGEPFIWAIAILPVVALFFCVNLYWGVLIVHRRQWSSGRIWLLTVLVWLTAIVIDFWHH